MANETTTTATADSIRLAAAALRGDTVEVAKSAPVEEAKETEEVAKADTPEQDGATEEVTKAEAQADNQKQDEQTVAKALSALLPDLIKAAVDNALAPVQNEIAEVRKSIGVVQDRAQATLDFQAATTGILTSLKGEVEEQREVQKSVAATVEAVAQQPAGRRGALGEEVSVAKSVAAPVIDLDPLRSWARESGFDVAQRITLVRQAEAGNYSEIPNEVRKAMGVQ